MFKKTVTPRFGEVDALRHVNNNVVGNWFELGREEIFKFFTPDLDLRLENWKLILVRTEIDFLSQIRYGKDVEIITYITNIGNSSFTIGSDAYQNNELKARGKAVIVHYDFIDKKSKTSED